MTLSTKLSKDIADYVLGMTLDLKLSLGGFVGAGVVALCFAIVWRCFGLTLGCRCCDLRNFDGLLTILNTQNNTNNNNNNSSNNSRSLAEIEFATSRLRLTISHGNTNLYSLHYDQIKTAHRPLLTYITRTTK